MRRSGRGKDRQTSPRRTAAKKPLAGRTLACDVLTAFESGSRGGAGERSHGPHLTQLFDSHCNARQPPPLERRLAMELAYGIVRRRNTVDAVLRQYVSRPIESIEPGLWRLLRLGAYQLALMSSIPPHAAVSETVQLARQVGKPQWTGFLNGVLRSLSRDLTDVWSDAPSPEGVPVDVMTADPDPGSVESNVPDAATESRRIRYRHFPRAIFPAPQGDPAGYLEQAFSLPRWLVDRWLTGVGWEETLRRAIWFAGPGVMWLRVNRQRSTREKILEILSACRIPAHAGTLPETIRLGRTVRVGDVPGFAEGLFTVQDESAQEAAHWLAPQPGERLLDLCAAPGGKATHLAEYLEDSGQVLAVDVDQERLERVRTAGQRLRLSNLAVRQIPDVRRDPQVSLTNVLSEGPFDAAIVDAPCSNTGVLGKRPDARWRIRPEDLLELPRLQARLLREAMSLVRPGGRLLYSTCSIEAEENAAVVQTAIAESPDWSRIRERTAEPGQPADGGYLALLQRRG